MTTLSAQPTLYKTPGDVLPVMASFAGELTSGDLLTGTPTVAVEPPGPTLSAASINTQVVKMEIEDNPHHARAGQAVQFTMSGGVAGRTYTVSVTCSTAGGRTFDDRPITVVVSSN